MSNKKTTNKLLGTEIRWSSFEVGKAKRKRRLRQASGQILGVSGRKRADNQRNNSKTLSFGEKLKKRKEKKQGWFHLDSGQAEADEGSVQRVELPHPGRVVAGSGRRPGPANLPGSLLWLKCFGSMASLAVHSSA